MIDGIIDTIKGIAAEAMADTETHANLSGVIVRSGTDGNVDIRLDDNRYGDGVSGIPIVSGLPVKQVTVPVGTRCSIGFDDELPHRVAVRSFEHDDAGGTVSVDIGSTRVLTLTSGGWTLTLAGTGEASISRGDTTVSIAATGDISCTVGDSTIDITDDSVEVTGTTVSVTATGDVEILGGGNVIVQAPLLTGSVQLGGRATQLAVACIGDLVHPTEHYITGPATPPPPNVKA